VRTLVHRLRGTAATYGFPDVSQAAGALRGRNPRRRAARRDRAQLDDCSGASTWPRPDSGRAQARRRFLPTALLDPALPASPTMSVPAVRSPVSPRGATLLLRLLLASGLHRRAHRLPVMPTAEELRAFEAAGPVGDRGSRPLRA
jgi:hypothetical protein